MSDILFGVDPSITSLGVSVFQGSELLDTHLIKPKKPKKGGVDDRLGFIVEEFSTLLEKYAPSYMVIESQYIGFNRGMSFFKVIEVKGLVEGLFIRKNQILDKEYNLCSVYPMEVKSSIGVSGKFKRDESKRLVKEKICQYYPYLIDKNYDITDAVAIGLCGIFRFNLKGISVNNKKL